MRNNIKVIDLDKGLTDVNPKVVSLGNFDGIHKGHQKLMKKNIEISKKYKLNSSVLLFKENTRKTLKDQDEYLTSLDDKIEILSNMGIDNFCIIEFNDKFRSLSPREFVEEILYKKLNTKVVVVGDDYHFGKNAKGNVDTLKSYEDTFDIKTEVIEFAYDNDTKISSRSIREFIKSGNIKKANSYLARPYQIRGSVIYGHQRGRNMNFPTANLELSYNYLIPIDGVYLTQANVRGKKYFALTNIGTNPTFENKERKIETYILDFNENIYGENISIEFLEFFRGDFKFNSVDELINQMNKDKKMAYELIENKYL